MGLDISAYSNAKKITGEFDDDKHVNVYIIDAFRAQADGLEEGCYEVNEYRKEEFRAGSYGGYNEWRNWLSKLVGKTDKEIWRAPDPAMSAALSARSAAESAARSSESAAMSARSSESVRKENKDLVQKWIVEHIPELEEIKA